MCDETVQNLLPINSHIKCDMINNEIGVLLPREHLLFAVKLLATTLSIDAKVTVASMGFQAYVSRPVSQVCYLKGIAEIRVCERIAVKIRHCIVFLITAFSV